MSDSNLQRMTDDDLDELISNARQERRRRSEEPKLPVFAVDGIYYKSLAVALEKLIERATYVLGFRDGNPEQYFGDYLTDCIDRTRLGLRIEFWSKSEYDARPDQVWGAPHE